MTINNIPVPIDLAWLLPTITEAAAPGGNLTIGPTADQNRERLTELGARVRELNEELLAVLREMTDLNGSS